MKHVNSIHFAKKEARKINDVFLITFMDSHLHFKCGNMKSSKNFVPKFFSRKELNEPLHPRILVYYSNKKNTLQEIKWGEGNRIIPEGEDEDEEPKEPIPKPANKKRKAEDGDQDVDTTLKPANKKRNTSKKCPIAETYLREHSSALESTPKHAPKPAKSLSPPTATSNNASLAPAVGCKCDELKEDVKDLKRDIMEMKPKFDDEKENENEDEKKKKMNEDMEIEEKENEDEENEKMKEMMRRKSRMKMRRRRMKMRIRRR
ncbi:transcription initiation factor TFIID subunit 11-like [Impatiens glandulifera]|uniref:transcription initiation factor TFIID subunit 11-like n=1 Tax=Impatiens glandulifera TaxID=253017 RepID=UPI001FB095DE|nr:transcription initiation factor TFIID subunit 11-like [Impatiens glandulifera]